MNNQNRPDWFKYKGYLHITPQIGTQANIHELIAKVTNPVYVEKYAFYPLLHATIKERRYKKIDTERPSRAHSYVKGDKIIKSVKSRPLHYATHMDALIFGYYAELLQTKYEKALAETPGLSDCVVAYRKIPDAASDKNKGTIHFAHESFDEIKTRAQPTCLVFKFDIRSFFSSIDHLILKKAWCDLLNVDELPKHHYNVFKASTRFSYILLDDLRLPSEKGKKRKGFDEKELAKIRKEKGIQAFFKSPRDFRDKIRSGEIRIHKYPFRHNGIPIGIPQGLPISAVLANLYLLEFDLKILKHLVERLNCYYRRYSDDIIIICSIEDADEVENFIVESIKERRVEISIDKREKFLFRTETVNKDLCRLTSVKIENGIEKVGIPFTYLGFEFYGYKTLIKSANLAKFYRRMISSVKRRVSRAVAIAEKTPGSKPIIYRGQLYRLYTNYANRSLNSTKLHTVLKRLVKDELGDYKLEVTKKSKKIRSNYLSYVKRASEIMNEEDIVKQIRNHKKIFNQSIYKQLLRKAKR